MDILVQHVINGITLGAMYALVAVGLSLVFGVVRLVNFAHGELFMLSGYLLVFLHVEKDLPYPFSVALTIVGTALFGILFERVVVRPVLKRSWRVQLIVTLAASMVLASAAIHIWGTTPRQAPTALSRTTLHMGAFGVVAYQRLLLVAAAVVCFAGLAIFLRRTKIGKAMRAMSQNREACVVYGIDINRISTVTFAIGAGLAGLAGAFITPLYAVWPSVGALLTLKAFVAVVIGGMGKTTGVIYAALLLGITEALFAGYVSFAFRDAAAFLILIVVLLFRPEGLFGLRTAT